MLLVSLTVFLGLFVSMVYFSLKRDKSPIFFPLDDRYATYTIVKSSIPANNSPEIILTNNPKYKYYLVEYKGNNIFPGLGKFDNFTVLVGQSKADLSGFVGKKVKLKGKFVGSSRQCIAKDCYDIFGPWVVLDIDEITAAE